jgi:hypothetical protein
LVALECVDRDCFAVYRSRRTHGEQYARPSGIVGPVVAKIIVMAHDESRRSLAGAS